MSALYHVHGLKAVHINKDAVPPKYIMILSMTLFLAIPHKHQSEAHSKPSKMYPKKVPDQPFIMFFNHQIHPNPNRVIYIKT